MTVFFVDVAARVVRMCYFIWSYNCWVRETKMVSVYFSYLILNCITNSFFRKIYDISHFLFILQKLLCIHIHFALGSLYHFLVHHLHIWVRVSVILFFGHLFSHFIHIQSVINVQFLFIIQLGLKITK
jgi:hypothetical protein